MIVITNKPTTTRSSIIEEFNIDILNCNFADCIENSSWTALPLTPEYINELENRILESPRAKQYADELFLIHKFREITNDNEMLIHIDRED